MVRKWRKVQEEIEKRKTESFGEMEESRTARVGKIGKV